MHWASHEGRSWRGSWTTVLPRVLLRAYRLTLSPVLGPHCRFSPSCSLYAEEALRRHGFARGGALAAKRVLRCHPWHPGGHDPVPAG